MFGKDSRLTFTAPAAGTYFIRLSDTRRMGSRHHAYRLTVAPPQPDFELSVSPSNPNVPLGGRVPVTVFVARSEGFEGPVDVALHDLPPGLTATTGREAIELDLAGERLVGVSGRNPRQEILKRHGAIPLCSSS